MQKLKPVGNQTAQTTQQHNLQNKLGQKSKLSEKTASINLASIKTWFWLCVLFAWNQISVSMNNLYKASLTYLCYVYVWYMDWSAKPAKTSQSIQLFPSGRTGFMFDLVTIMSDNKIYIMHAILGVIEEPSMLVDITNLLLAFKNKSGGQMNDPTFEVFEDSSNVPCRKEPLIITPYMKFFFAHYEHDLSLMKQFLNCMGFETKDTPVNIVFRTETDSKTKFISIDVNKNKNLTANANIVFGELNLIRQKSKDLN